VLTCCVWLILQCFSLLLFSFFFFFIFLLPLMTNKLCDQSVNSEIFHVRSEAVQSVAWDQKLKEIMTKIRHNDERTDNCDVQSRVREGSPVRVTLSQRQFTAHWINVAVKNIWSMVDNTKMLCPLFDETEILIPCDSPRASSNLWTKCEILIRYRNEEKQKGWLSQRDCGTLRVI